MRKHLLTLALVLFAFTAMFAQHATPEEFLNATDEMFEEHSGDFAEAPEEIVAMYDEAVATQEEAWDLFEEGEEMGAMALSHTARMQLQNALRILEHGGECPGPGEPGEGMIERIETELDRTDEIIENTTEILGEDASEEALELLNNAIELQAEARTAFEAEEYVGVMGLTGRARSLASRAARVVIGPGGGYGHGGHFTPERVLAQLEATDGMIERFSADIEESGNEDAIALLEEAVEIQAEAYANYEEEEYEEALRLTRTSSSLVERAVRMIHRDVAEGEVATALDETDGIIEEATVTIEASDDEAVLIMLERAIELQESARENYDEGNYVAALNQTMNARRIIEHALRLLEVDIEE